ncbi:hypothetical protein ACLOJK_037419 [Asimina triloba]
MVVAVMMETLACLLPFNLYCSLTFNAKLPADFCCHRFGSGFGVTVAHHPMLPMMLPWPLKMEKTRTGRKNTDAAMIGDKGEALLIVVDRAYCHWDLAEKRGQQRQ